MDQHKVDGGLRQMVWRVLLALAYMLAAGTSAAEVVPAVAAPEAAIAQILGDAGTGLGWPREIVARPDLRGEAWQIAASGGAQRAVISVADGLQAPSLLDDLRVQGLVLGLYRGREAVISRPEDPLAAGRGVIAWRCGPYTLAAHDDAGAGREDAIAAALADAADAHNLCGLPASLVIRAETDDLPGTPSPYFAVQLDYFQMYYTANAYNRVDFAFTLGDADGPAGDDDWFSIGPALADYAGREFDLVVAALRAAAATLSPASPAYVDRVIVVTPFDTLNRATGSTSPRAMHVAGGAAFEIGLPATGGRVYVSDLVLISQADMLGTWAHELGHTLYSRVASAQGVHRITDRYICEETGGDVGDVGIWDLMGIGSETGAVRRAQPTHMSSYTKQAAGWLRYAPGRLNETYTLTALEWQQPNDAILTLDDPLSDDPGAFYIVEARDAAASYGPPTSGVIVYHVISASHGRGDTVTKLPLGEGAQAGPIRDRSRARPTLHGVGDPDGRTRLDLPGGVCIELVSELFEPYRATVRVGAC
ncbi:MAG: hypothetical protein JXA74_10770 [Anaerolineae bacterium]|nr:hypothetical protein [Anaerolineae bacterium]